jgi:hypothetical protein
MSGVPGVALLEETCFACPTTYDFVLDVGNRGYLRYRHGTWRIVVHVEDGEDLVVSGQEGGPYDGHMDYDRVRDLLAEHLPLLINRLVDEREVAAANERVAALLADGISPLAITRAAWRQSR